MPSSAAATLREAVTGTADGDLTAPKALVEAMYRHRNEQRDARYFVVKTADSEMAAPTDEEIKAEYEANPAAYTAPEYRTIAIMKVEPADIVAKIELTDDEFRPATRNTRRTISRPRSAPSCRSRSPLSTKPRRPGTGSPPGPISWPSPRSAALPKPT